MDLKLELENISKKSSALRRVRKSGLPFSFSLSPRDDVPSEAPESGGSSVPKSRRSGGWASETLKSAIRRSSSAFFEQDQLNERMKIDDDDIPVIPNLDDYDDDEVAKAPMVGHKVSSYKELEQDLLKHAAFSSLEDVNLRVLTSYLQNETALSEPDVPWTRSTLFSDILNHVRLNEVGELSK